MRHWATETGRPIERRRAILAVFAVSCAWLLPVAAQAQVSGSVGALSDYRYRGYSLSDGDPALQASIAYDAASGAYGGLFASTTRLAGSSGAQWIPYVGIARRDRQGRSWDVGVRYVAFTDLPFDGDYAEAHVGVAFRRVAVRLHFAPDYYGAADNTYLEADAAFPLGERVRLLLHGGASRSGEADRTVYGYRNGYGYGNGSGHGEPADIDRTRIDFSAGVLVPTGLCDVQATWHHVDGSDYTGSAVPWNPTDRSGFVLGCVKRW